MNYIVYCTTCKVNGKIYIGVHKTENPEIFDGYIGNGLKVGWMIKNPKTAFQYAVKKYGYKNFVRSTLYVFNTAEEAYSKEAEIVNLRFVKDNNNYNTSLGGISSGTCYDSLYQYDYSGNFIKEWNSVQEAINFYGCNSNMFNMAITDKRSAFNSYWTKEYFTNLDVSNYKKSKHSEIYCYDLEGNLIKLYNSVKEIESDLGFTNASINDACQHKRPLKGYYFISDNTDVLNLIKIRNNVLNLSDNSVSKYKNGIRIQTYCSLKQAAKENNTTTNHIKKSIQNNEGIWSFGYSNSYVQNIQHIPVKIAQYDLEGNYVKTWQSIAQCRKNHPKVKEVLCGVRTQTHGFTFKIIE